MENENGKLILAPALKAIKEQLRKPDANRLVEMRNDWDGIRMFLLGGFHHEGIWPAGSISCRCDSDDIVVTLSIHSLEIEAKYRYWSWDPMWIAINNELLENIVPWQMDWKGRERLERRISMS